MTGLQITRSTEPVLTHARGVHLLLDVAEHEQLPMPFDVSFTRSGIRMLVRGHEAFTAWAAWVDEPVTVNISERGYYHHVVAGELLELPVEVVWVEQREDRS